MVVTITFSLLIGIVIMAGFVPSIEDLMVAKFAGITLAHFFTFLPLVSSHQLLQKARRPWESFILVAIFIPFFAFMISTALNWYPPTPPSYMEEVEIGSSGEVVRIQYRRSKMAGIQEGDGGVQ